MAWEWINKLVQRIASEAHKSKIEDFEKRIVEMEKNQNLIMKSLQISEESLKKMDERIYNANIESAKAIGAIETVIQRGEVQKKLNQGHDEK